MSNIVMLKRAFNQAVATGAVRLTDRDADFLVIKAYMTEYAKKNGVEISTEEISAFIKEQQNKLYDISTTITGSGHAVKIDNVSISNVPVRLTKEEMLKEAFDDAASNAAVHFTDKVADFLVIRNAMMDYARLHNQAFTLDEIETYINQQDKMWENTVTEIKVIGADVTVENVSSTYETAPMTKEEVLKEGFAYAAGSDAVKFADEKIDFLVIKNMMQSFAETCAVEVSDQEIVAYIEKAFAKMNESVKDFSYNYQMMK